jgi:hypothetical protein
VSDPSCAPLLPLACGRCRTPRVSSGLPGESWADHNSGLALGALQFFRLGRPFSLVALQSSSWPGAAGFEDSRRELRHWACGFASGPGPDSVRWAWTWRKFSSGVSRTAAKAAPSIATVKQARPREHPLVRMFLPKPVAHCLLMNAYRCLFGQGRLARHRSDADRRKLLSRSDSHEFRATQSERASKRASNLNL